LGPWYHSDLSGESTEELVTVVLMLYSGGSAGAESQLVLFMPFAFVYVFSVRNRLGGGRLTSSFLVRRIGLTAGNRHSFL